MTDFTKDELETIAAALDMMVRAEGNAMSQAGINGIANGRVDVLTRRLNLSVAALTKVSEALASILVPEAPPPTTGG